MDKIPIALFSDGVKKKIFVKFMPFIEGIEGMRLGSFECHGGFSGFFLVFLREIEPICELFRVLGILSKRKSQYLTMVIKKSGVNLMRFIKSMLLC